MWACVAPIGILTGDIRPNRVSSQNPAEIDTRRFCIIPEMLPDTAAFMRSNFDLDLTASPRPVDLARLFDRPVIRHVQLFGQHPAALDRTRSTSGSAATRQCANSFSQSSETECIRRRSSSGSNSSSSRPFTQRILLPPKSTPSTKMSPPFCRVVISTETSRSRPGSKCKRCE
jgi:hypothetical protein